MDGRRVPSSQQAYHRRGDKERRQSGDKNRGASLALCQGGDQRQEKPQQGADPAGDEKDHDPARPGDFGARDQHGEKKRQQRRAAPEFRQSAHHGFMALALPFACRDLV